MPVFRDQLNRKVTVPATPVKIISIVPSQTELLFDLGLNVEIIGITKFCIHRRKLVQDKTKIGGTKALSIPMIHSLQPDLIIANKEENEQGQIEELMANYPVWVSDIHDLPGALDMIRKIGELVGRRNEAAILSGKVTRAFENITPLKANLKVAYLIWRKPYMAAGTGTFINAMLQICGFVNAFDTERYPEVSIERLMAAAPDVLLLSSEPYPFSQKHIEEFEKLLPNTKVLLVDGEMFSWYGSRLLLAPSYFMGLINTLR